MTLLKWKVLTYEWHAFAKASSDFEFKIRTFSYKHNVILLIEYDNIFMISNWIYLHFESLLKHN